MRLPSFARIRAVVLFAAGLLGVAWVTLIDQTDRPTLLILFGAMLGLPLFLKNDANHSPPPHPATVPPVPPDPVHPPTAGSP